MRSHEDFTLINRVLDLTSCGLIGVSDASLGVVDRFGYPTDQDSKTVKVYSQAGIGIFIGKTSLVSLGARGKFKVLECDSRTIIRVCREKCTIVQETTHETKRDRVVHDYRDGCPRRT